MEEAKLMKGGISAMFKPLAPKETDKPLAARGKKKKTPGTGVPEPDSDMQITAINVKIEAAVSLVKKIIFCDLFIYLLVLFCFMI